MGPGAVSGEFGVIRIPQNYVSLFKLADDLAPDGFSCVLCVFPLVMLLNEKQDIVNPQPDGISLWPWRAFAHVCQRQECERGHLVALGCRQAKRCKYLLSVFYASQFMNLRRDCFLVV